MLQSAPRVLRRSMTTWTHWDATGDCRRERWMENENDSQQLLPRLPVPTVFETLERFLPTALPLIESDAERHALLDAVQRFPQQAAHLQDRLLQRQQEECADTSWLQDWWNTLGYLRVRDSNLLHVSYFFQLPHSNVTGLQRAADVVAAILAYQPPTNPQPYCFAPYKYLLNACRIPKPVQDVVRLYNPQQQSHIVIACRGLFYALEPGTQLQAALQAIVHDAATQQGSTDSLAPGSTRRQ